MVIFWNVLSLKDLTGNLYTENGDILRCSMEVSFREDGGEPKDVEGLHNTYGCM
jgi:hypothetical protein